MRLLLVLIFILLVGTIAYRLVEPQFSLGQEQPEGRSTNRAGVQMADDQAAPEPTAHHGAETTASVRSEDKPERKGPQKAAPVSSPAPVPTDDPAVERVRSLLANKLKGSVHAPQPIEPTPHQLFKMLQESRIQRDDPVKMVYKTDPTRQQAWQPVRVADWSDLSPLRGKGPNWVGGMWHLDYEYQRPHMLHWVNDHIQDRATDHRRLLRGLVAAVGLSSSYDPALACVLNLATVRLSSSSAWEAAVIRQIALWKRLGRTDLSDRLLADPLGCTFDESFQASDAGLAHLPALQGLGVASAAVDDVFLLIALGEHVPDALIEQLSKRDRKRVDHLLAQLTGGVQAAYGEALDKRHVGFAAKALSFSQSLELPITERYSELTDQDLMVLGKQYLNDLGAFSDITADTMLYMVEERDCAGYLDRPQKMLYAAIHVHRTYGGARSFPLYAWVQRAGLVSPAEGKSLYHDRFNAMEAPLYLAHAVKTPVVRGCDAVHGHLIAMAERSIGLSFDPATVEMFLPTWRHRWMSLISFQVILRWIDEERHFEPWYAMQMNHDLGIPLRSRLIAMGKYATYKWRTGQDEAAINATMDYLSEADGGATGHVLERLIRYAVDEQDEGVAADAWRLLERKKDEHGYWLFGQYNDDKTQSLLSELRVIAHSQSNNR